ncbi:hypothetical protein SNEBB_010647 [Seison nebaliae]|nr:hypothetical protein SNEBB_010647 [Seison nebaliae]
MLKSFYFVGRRGINTSALCYNEAKNMLGRRNVDTPVKSAQDFSLSIKENEEKVDAISGVKNCEIVSRKATIYVPSKNPMQSGTYNCRKWKIQFDTKERWENPLMGWCSSADPLASLDVTLEFQSLNDAKVYCERMNYPYEVKEPNIPKKVIKIRLIYSRYQPYKQTSREKWYDQANRRRERTGDYFGFIQCDLVINKVPADTYNHHLRLCGMSLEENTITDTLKKEYTIFKFHVASAAYSDDVLTCSVFGAMKMNSKSTELFFSSNVNLLDRSGKSINNKNRQTIWKNCHITKHFIQPKYSTPTLTLLVFLGLVGIAVAVIIILLTFVLLKCGVKRPAKRLQRYVESDSVD